MKLIILLHMGMHYWTWPLFLFTDSQHKWSDAIHHSSFWMHRPFR